MILSDKSARKFLRPLYHTAEKDTNDVIANAASALAVRIEQARDNHALSDIDVRVIQHAVSKMPEQVEPVVRRRKTYKRRVSLA